MTPHKKLIELLEKIVLGDRITSDMRRDAYALRDVYSNQINSGEITSFGLCLSPKQVLQLK